MFALALLVVAPASAQTIAVRPFALASVERVSAQTTFKAVFDSATAAAWGGGVDVVFNRKVFVDLAISRMTKTGERAFLDNGQAFTLGIPLRMTLTPVEVVAGYRFRARSRLRSRRTRVFPYVGVGIGWYQYREAADFAAAGDDVDARATGFVAMGGAEMRVSRWASVSADAHYTKVPGILGAGGLSKDAGESDLGGIAARVRVIIGR